MSDERRRTPRLPCDLGAVWRRGRLFTAVRIRSLNAHGMLIDAGEAVASSYLLDLQVFLPSGPCSLLAVARNGSPIGIGTSIHSIDAPDGRRLLGFYWSLRQRPPVRVGSQRVS